MEKEEEIKELKDRIKLIEEYYEESNIIKRIRFYLKYIKEKKKNANYRNSTKNDTTRNNTVSDNSNGNTWDVEISKIFNDKKIEKEENNIAKIIIKINGIEQCMGIGRKKDLEKLKEKMEQDKEKMKKFKIEEIKIK